MVKSQRVAEAQNAVIGAVKASVRWLVWKPSRLALALLGVIVVAVVLHMLTHAGSASEGQETPSMIPSATVSGWQSWPSVAVSPATALPSSREESSTVIVSPSVEASSTTVVSSSRPVSPSDEDSPMDSASDVPAMWDTASRSAVIAAGVQVVEAYAAGDQTRLDALLAYGVSVTARQTAVTVSSATLPGDVSPYLESEASALFTTVKVPTSIGEWAVTMNRLDGNSPWLCVAVVPPESL